MELMEVMLRNGLVLLGNQSIYFTFNISLLFYFLSSHILGKKKVPIFYSIHVAKPLLSLIFYFKC